VREVRAGIWHWEASHPEWGETVSSYAIDDGERLLLFDPLAAPHDVVSLAANRETAIVLTCPWHRRDALDLAAQLGVDIHVPPPDGADPEPVPGRIYRIGAHLPIGVEAFPGMEPNDLVLWVSCRGALVVGDTLIDRGDGLEFPRDWADGKPQTSDEILQSLQTLLHLPVEVVLPTHGPPTDRAGLARAISFQ
jgi:glyoxylase-like metal-dependent hydrolase (beta-lactamase superfamily II)